MMGPQPLRRGPALNLLPTIRKIALHPVFLLSTCLVTPSKAIQVTPNSGCASVCIDDSTQDVSDPDVSNTVGSDIVCNDSDYSSSATGQKFKDCIECLQGSSAVGSGENDQGWFFYNLRYALNTCLFATAKASDPISTPCSIDTVCGPLQGALQDGMSSPATMSQYSYCSAYSNSFLGTFLGSCTDCLRENEEQKYMSNFLVALHGGCVQQPEPGTLVGLNGTVFSKYEVVITSPVTNNNKSHKKLSEGAIIGIAVGGVVLFVALIAIAFICIRRRRNAARLKELRSPLDSRFGAENITSPHRRDWSSPDYSPSFVKESMPLKPTPIRTTNSSSQVSLRPGEDNNYTNALNPTGGALPNPPLYSPPLKFERESVPISYAYSPPEYTPQSRMSVSPVASPQPPPPKRQPTEPHRGSSNSASTARSAVLSPQPGSAPQPHHRTSSNSASTVRSTGSPSHPIGLPSRPNRTLSNSSSTVRSAVSPLATQKTNTTTRDIIRDRTARATGPTPSQISGPIVSVESRFQDEEQARKAREKLYKQGIGGIQKSSPRVRESPDRGGDDSESDALW